MVKKLVLLAFLSSGLVLSACNTVRGAGQDMESVANDVDDAT